MKFPLLYFFFIVYAERLVCKRLLRTRPGVMRAHRRESCTAAPGRWKGRHLKWVKKWVFQNNNRVTNCIMTRFVFGGRGWIRTIEVTDNRFTVCPLWPLGNSPIFTFCCLTSGAGGRIRTPDLLITNQLLYQLSYTSTSATVYIIARGKPFVNIFTSPYFLFFHFIFYCHSLTVVVL